MAVTRMAVPSIHPRHQLGHRSLRPKKSFGQNFLHDDVHLQNIARVVMDAPPASPLVELGGGTGALTALLVEHPGPLHVVERDRDLVPILADRFSEHIAAGHLTLHEANATKFEAAPIMATVPGVLCGNLPYHLTSELLDLSCRLASHLHHAVFLIQLEVADRVCAEPGNKTWGALSVGLQATFKVQRALTIPKDAFWPAPDVDGGVIVLRPRPQHERDRAPLSVLRPLVRTAFSQRRKRLSNALKSRPEALAAMRDLKIDIGLRPEALSVAQWQAVAERLPLAAPSDSSSSSSDSSSSSSDS